MADRVIALVDLVTNSHNLEPGVAGEREAHARERIGVIDQVRIRCEEFHLTRDAKHQVDGPQRVG